MKPTDNRDPVIAVRIDSASQKAILEQAERMVRANPSKTISISDVVRTLIRKNA